MFITPFLILFAAQNKVPATWTEQSFLDRLTVSTPAKLTKFDTGTSPDKSVSFQAIWVAKVGNTVFQVLATVASEPGSWKSNTILSGALVGLQKQDSIVIGARDIAVQGWQGLAITTRLKNGTTMAARAFFYDDAIIGINCIYPSKDPHPAAVDLFFNSLRFKKAGTAKGPGASLDRYDLGDSGISALFPAKPTQNDAPLSQRPNAQTMHQFSSDYCARIFLVVYRDSQDQDIGTLTDDKKKQIYAAATEEVSRAFKANTSSPREFKVGKDVGSRTALTVTGQAKGEVAVFLHGRHLVTIMEIGPENYDSPETVEAFLGSLQVK